MERRAGIAERWRGAEGLAAAEMQQELADRYAELFEIFYRKRDKIDRVMLWGVHDPMSWKNDYPVLFGRDRQPKPAFDAVFSMAQRIE